MENRRIHPAWESQNGMGEPMTTMTIEDGVAEENEDRRKRSSIAGLLNQHTGSPGDNGILLYCTMRVFTSRFFFLSNFVKKIIFITVMFLLRT